ncbi:hypothetical protein HDU76_010035 [Blyttiomyces sp. JEL0837]|nr:hypothetical protein HDU76_010035 [Blyttiomyces sp. JEL0837]
MTGLNMPIIRSWGGNQVVFTPQVPSNLLPHLPSGATINAAVAESQTGFYGTTLNFTVTWNATSSSISFRTTDIVRDWPTSITTNPHLLYSIDGSNWTYSGVDARVLDVDRLWIGVLFTGTIGDAGWSYSQNQGTLASTSSFGNSIVWFMQQGLSYEPTEASSMVKTFVESNKLDLVITATSGLYAINIQKYSEILFNEGSINPSLPHNFNAAFIRQDVGRYLSGIAAGAMAEQTGSSTVGFIAAFRDPEIMAGANSFFLGVQRILPNATMKVRVVNVYYDEYTEKQASERFLSEKVTVLSHQTDSLQPMKVIAHFCMVMVLCFCFGLIGNFLFGLDEDIVSSKSTLDNACKALPWVVSLPSTIGIGALFAKVWRVKQIFHNKNAQSLSLKDHVLFAILAIILAPDLILVAIWSGVRPLQWKRLPLMIDEYGFTISSYGVCMEGDGSHISFFVLLAAVYKSIILAYGSVLAQQTRNVPTALNESEVINFCLVVAFEVLAIIFPLNYVITTSPAALFVFRAGSNLLINFGIPLTIMLPKISHVIWPNEKNPTTGTGGAGASYNAIPATSSSHGIKTTVVGGDSALAHHSRLSSAASAAHLKG